MALKLFHCYPIGSNTVFRILLASPYGIDRNPRALQVCIITGTVASMVSLWGYGFSTNYVAALLSRALPALFVASPVALKSMIGDVCNQTGQAKAMASKLYFLVTSFFHFLTQFLLIPPFLDTGFFRVSNNTAYKAEHPYTCIVMTKEFYLE